MNSLGSFCPLVGDLVIFLVVRFRVVSTHVCMCVSLQVKIADEHLRSPSVPEMFNEIHQKYLDLSRQHRAGSRLSLC